ncbi:MAG TPA: hypothetical protein PKA63_07620 [Oligoflexia bacterium]|nr:hypothetical protein [Oligoflexia bacterium]HMP48518.1 hypothetical protein [Oligoflexia bacterium]
MSNCKKNSPEDEMLTTRGLKNPKVIDLIRAEPGKKETKPIEQNIQSVVLYMIEDRPWSDSHDHFSQLSEKFNNYLDFVVDGWLFKQYPQYKGCSVIIELCLSDSKASENFKRMSEELKSFASRYQITFRYSCGFTDF